jgi:hypothetical protein
MIDYVSFLLEARAAKRRLARLFESETLGRADHLSTATVAYESSSATRTLTEHNNKRCRESPCAHRLVRNRTRTALPTGQPGQMKRDLSVSSFVLAVVLVGVLLAAHTDRPIFWLLIGPAPLAVLHTLRTFLRPGLKRPGDSSSFTNRIDDISNFSLKQRNLVKSPIACGCGTDCFRSFSSSDGCAAATAVSDAAPTTTSEPATRIVIKDDLTIGVPAND